jgi:hypothetical protein
VFTRILASKQPIFADGNITSAFENFEREHKCNKYCSFYRLAKLRPPLQPWERMKRDANRFARELEEDAAEDARVGMVVETGEITEGGRTLRAKRP